LKELVDEVDERQVSISAVCDSLEINRKTYYNHFKPKENAYKLRREELGVKIKQIHQDSKEIYGAPKMTRKLRSQGEVVSEKLVGNIMRELGLKAHYAKPWTKTTKNCDFSKELKNILKRDFNPAKPNAVWCTDITYIWTKEDGFVYLTSIMDLYSRKIIAWTLSRTLMADEVLVCLQKAQSKRYLDKAIVIHSDRGSPYVSKLYKELTLNMITRYSNKGNPWDNAPIESFHALIKREWLNRNILENYEHTYSLVFEYIEGFYNIERTHSFCDYMSPNDYELQFAKSISA
jgi:putative transposase